MIRITFKGGQELHRALDALPVRMRDNLLRRAVNAATKPIRERYRAYVPVEYGVLKKGIGIRIKRYVRGNRRGTVVGIVGARVDAEAMVPSAFGKYKRRRAVKTAHLVEGGTVPHVLPGAGTAKKALWRHPGTEATHALSRAFQSSRGEAMDILEAYLKGFISGH